jgi:hypothetical protein
MLSPRLTGSSSASADPTPTIVKNNTKIRGNNRRTVTDLPMLAINK